MTKASTPENQEVEEILGKLKNRYPHDKLFFFRNEEDRGPTLYSVQERRLGLAIETFKELEGKTLNSKQYKEYQNYFLKYREFYRDYSDLASKIGVLTKYGNVEIKQPMRADNALDLMTHKKLDTVRLEDWESMVVNDTQMVIIGVAVTHPDSKKQGATIRTPAVPIRILNKRATIKCADSIYVLGDPKNYV